MTQIVRGRNTVDGAGVHLRRILGEQTVHDFDPFLMLDGFDSTNPQDYIKGFPWHPHRGIETVTYLVSGTMKHEDSLGKQGGDPVHGMPVDDSRFRNTPSGDAAAIGKDARMSAMGQFARSKKNGSAGIQGH